MNNPQNTEAAELIAQIQGLVQFGSRRLTAAFQSVPDDKLAWSPAPSGRNTLQIIAHVCAVSERLAGAFRGEQAEPTHREEAITSRDQAAQWLETSTQDVLASLGTLTPARIASDMPTPFGTMPMRRMMLISGIHLFGHAGQIDYLQTLWGDPEMHF